MTLLGGSDVPLAAPWGVAIAPASFGKFAGDLLVGNFSFAHSGIDAFDRKTGKFEGTIKINPTSRASTRRAFVGAATMKVRSGPTTTSTPTMMASTVGMSARYHPGQWYQPRYSRPSVSVNALALPTKCHAKALNLNRIRLALLDQLKAQ